MDKKVLIIVIKIINLLYSKEKLLHLMHVLMINQRLKFSLFYIFINLIKKYFDIDEFDVD